MAYRVIYSPQSLADLDNVVGYIAIDNQSAAMNFRQSLLDHINNLSEFPEMSLLYAKRAGVRRLVHNPVSVYYRFVKGKGRVDILHIRHDRRRPPVF